MNRISLLKALIEPLDDAEIEEIQSLYVSLKRASRIRKAELAVMKAARQVVDLTGTVDSLQTALANLDSLVMPEKEADKARDTDSYKRARGTIPWQEGDEPAEESIRRIRGG